MATRDEQQYDITQQDTPISSLPSGGGLRYVGADIPPSLGSSINPGNLPQANPTPLQYLEQGGQYLTGAREYERQSSKQRLQSVANAQQAVGQTISQGAQTAVDIAKAKAASVSGGGLNGFETLVKAVGNYFEIQKKKEAEEQAAKQKVAYASAFQEIQDLKVRWRETGLDENGVSSYISTLKSTLAKYPDLSLEQVQKLTDDGYSVALTYATEKSHRQQDYWKKVFEANRDVTVAGLQLSINNDLGKLRTDIYSDTAPILDSINTKIGQFLDNPNIDPLTAAVGLSTSLKATLESMDKHNVAYQELARQVQNLDVYAQRALDRNAAVERGELSPTEALVANQRDRLELGIGSGIKDPEPFASEKLLQEQLARREGIFGLQEQGAIRAAEAQQMDNESIAYLAWGIINNPKTLQEVKANKVFASIPGVKTAIQLAEEYKNGEKTRNSLTLDLQQVRERLAEAQKQDLNWFIAQANKGGGGSDSISEILAVQLGIQLPKVQNANQLTPEQAAQYQAASKAYQDELVNRYNILTQQYQQSTSMLSSYGLVGDRNAIQTRMNTFKARYETFVKHFPDATKPAQQRQPSGGAASPFDPPPSTRSGRVEKTPLLTLNYQGKKAALPFFPSAQVNNLDNYGEKRSYGIHEGADLPVPLGTPIVSPVNGKVVRVEDHGNESYGYFIDVLGDDGMLHRYAHLTKNSAYHRVGTRIVAGQVLGKSGTTGRSDGPHLHWEIRDPSKPFGYERTVDPIAYMANKPSVSPARKPRTLSDTSWYLKSPITPGTSQQFATRIPADAIPLPGGYYILGNKLHKIPTPKSPTQVSKPVNQVYTNVAPLRSGVVPRDPKAYGPNDPNANYGYSIFARDKQFARKVAEVSTRLGVPAQWLSDLMAFETGGTFDPSLHNGIGYYGLIQFGADAATDMGVTTGQLASMSRVQQMEYVYKYLAKFGSQIRKGPEYLLASVWGGQGLLNAINKRGLHAVLADPAWNDGWITFGNYAKRLGEHAGRRYGDVQTRENRVSQRVHTSFKTGCSLCNSLRASNSMFIPHEQPA